MFHERVPETFQPLPTSAERRRSVWSALLPRRGRAFARIAMSSSLAVAEIGAIVAVILAVEFGYQIAFAGDSVWVTAFRGLRLAALLSAIIVSSNVLREDYSLDGIMAQKLNVQRIASLWLVAWAAVLVVGFLTKTTNDYSRIVSITAFLLGLPALLLTRTVATRLVRRSLTAGSASASRVHLVGYEEDIARFYASHEAEQLGSRIVGTSYLRRVDPGADTVSRHDQLQEDLDLAVSVVRFLRPDDVFVLVPWTDTAEVERCIDAFLRVPSALHLRPGSVLDRFPDMQVARVGGVSGINIGRRPLNVTEILLKRALDLTVAAIALVSLSPLLAAIAVAIKLDSPGPVFFRQKRYGFNQQPFGVFKFRSMRADANAVFKQATRNDSRITQVGAILRRTNLDELPQLLNVLKGEMSLVGPRPHALAHDRSFERRIALYARRHNVRPGITGWAQVNGYRGETLTDLDMERRVACDLHYIDNWSIWFDLQIMVQTIVSRRAYKNAR
ncbi:MULTISPECIES: undecaprenyl-phosphate glucose phosphotransferase [Methylobacterium]|uniref:undecaprenyl-phosphate glucose phosphotransferase n=1 Tax=Methylobacterium TaxID=407 RepID=UPI0011C7B64A|nr:MULTISPECIES: undecaprenyl-phosphate glucose phosphotransferase [Methylobacterium]TXN47055.1 undecaprenyl-phosphate glucose phosphotransferase [Methylobacterium sp. WL7]TXN72872.1 undecaprenyl-phosphate glucose phosphotransferase [Methylobacterium sp. WL18]